MQNYKGVRLFLHAQKTVCGAAPRRLQMKLIKRLTTADTCTDNCVMLRRSWIFWDLLVSRTQTATTEPCSKFKEWRDFWSTTSPRQAWMETGLNAARVRKGASTMGTLPRSAVKEGCHGGLSLLDGYWWLQPVVCQDTSPWCMGWHTGKNAL